MQRIDGHTAAFSAYGKVCIIGQLVDEAGCAPLAGPVVASAVVLPQWVRKPRAPRLKRFEAGCPTRARSLYAAIIKIARFGVGIATVEEIDMLNIYQANMLAMRRHRVKLCWVQARSPLSTTVRSPTLTRLRCSSPSAPKRHRSLPAHLA